MTNAKFEIGKTYMTRSPCDHDCIITLTVAKRTAKSITTTEGQRFMICTRYSADEKVFPWGKYSMCPSLSAEQQVTQ